MNLEEDATHLTRQGANNSAISVIKHNRAIFLVYYQLSAVFSLIDVIRLAKFPFDSRDGRV
jgi:hypothetical protein